MYGRLMIWQCVEAGITCIEIQSQLSRKLYIY
jgi:hypothetical protein